MAIFGNTWYLGICMTLVRSWTFIQAMREIFNWRPFFGYFIFDKLHNFSLFPSFWSCARQQMIREENSCFRSVESGTRNHMLSTHTKDNNKQAQHRSSHLIFNWFLNCYSVTTMIPCERLFTWHIRSQRRGEKELSDNNNKIIRYYLPFTSSEYTW